MNKKLLPLVYGLFAACSLSVPALGQSPKDAVSIPSPNATALGTFGETPVSLFTGTPSVNIPLYEIKEGSLSVPISLSYNATGVRPDVHPGWTGMNWGLNAGGLVTRVVKGIPDETAWKNAIHFSTNQDFNQNFFLGYRFNYPKLQTTNWNTAERVKELAKSEQWVDTEPDEFIFNFNGISGKFYQDEKGVWRVVSDPTIRVELDQTFMEVAYPNYLASPAFGGNQNIDALYTSSEIRIKGFRITTPDGVQYEFGLWNKEQILEDLSIEASIDFFQEGYFGESWDSWYLSRIVSPEGAHVIEFTYELGDPVASFGETVAMNRQAGQSTPKGIFKLFGPVSASSFEITKRYTGRLIYPLYLKEIKSTHTLIHFKRSPTAELAYNYNAIFSDLVNQASKSFNPALYMLPARYPIAASAADAYNNKPGVGVFTRKDMEIIDPLTGASKVNGNVMNFLNTILLESSSNPYRTGHFTFDGINILEGVDFTKLKWYKLDAIEIKDRTNANTMVKSYSLQYTNNTAHRLMLLSVQERGENGAVNSPYQFAYEDYNSDFYPGSYSLPPYNSYKVDHWGFFNNNSFQLSTADFTNAQKLGPDYYNSREPVEQYLYTGVLNTITLPTGGTTQFTYEPHKYSSTVVRDAARGDFALRQEAAEKTAGGLRIKQIRSDAGHGAPVMVKTYRYADGMLGGENQYYWPGYQGRFLESDAVYTADRFVTQTLLPVSSNSAGGHIGYSKVVETEQGAGRTEYFYSNHHSTLDENFDVSIDPQKSPYSPFSSTEMERGKLLEVHYYNEAGDPVKKEKNVYAANANQGKNYLRAIATKQIPVFEGVSIEGTAYKIYTYPYTLLAHETTVYDQNDLAKASTTKITYAYNLFGQVAEKKVLQSAGTALITNFTYPNDYQINSTLLAACDEEYEECWEGCEASSQNRDELGECRDGCRAARDACRARAGNPTITDPVFMTLQAMQQKNMVSPVVEETNWIENTAGKKLLTATLNRFKNFAVGGLQIEKRFTLNTAIPLTDFKSASINTANNFTSDTRYQLESEYLQYNYSGNLLESRRVNHPSTTYLWGYNRSYVVATVENATYEQVRDALGGDLAIDALAQSASLSSAQTNQLNTLRQSLPNAMVTTYTYELLKGMTSQTSPAGLTTSYEYDDLGRLKLVKDQDGKIIKRYAYHYRE